MLVISYLAYLVRAAYILVGLLVVASLTVWGLGSLLGVW